MYKLFLILVLGLSLLTLGVFPVEALHIIEGVDDCATDTCPTGDASLGVGFQGLQPSDLKQGTFKVTLSNSGSFQCAYSSSGIAGNSGSCNATFDGNDINCQINHLDCRNGAFDVSVSAPAGYSCSSNQSSISLNNCSNNTPITVSCTPPCTPTTCDASEPACGQTTAGTNNCGGACTKTGPACPQTFTIGGRLTRSDTGAGISSVTINQGVTTPPSCNIGTANTNSQGNYSFTNVAKDLSFCLRPPAITAFTGPDPASFENQTATANKSDYNFSYTPALGPQPPEVTCSADKTSANTGDSVIWTASVTEGVPPFTFSWKGSDSLNDKTGNPVTVSYTTTGNKTGSVKVTDSAGQTSPLTACTNSVTITAPAPAPTVSLTANPSSIANNASSTLSWTTTSCTTTNSCSCSASGSWSGSKSISGGSQSTGNLTGPANYTYTLTCTNSNGTSLPSTANVSVGGATCTAETDSAFCSRLGKNCGSVSGTDNCGATRTVTSCGTCSGSQTCGGGGTPNVCGGSSCTPETDPAFCTRLGKNCGTVSGTDNCGATRTVTSCGTCSGSQTCGGGGTVNVCGGSSSPSGTSPWIQTVGGDVHSNTNINTPGGP